MGASIAVTADGRDEWIEARETLHAHGSVLVHGRLPDWRPQAADNETLSTAVGGGRTGRRQLAHAAARERRAASHLLLGHAVAVALCTDVAEIELTRGPTGRPAVRGCDQIDISLSHTADLLLVGLTTRGLIGVDAEPADRRLRAAGLERRVCTVRERGDLDALPPRERASGLLRLWTLKESYTKAIGQGQRFPFDAFGFGPEGEPVRVHRPDGTPATGSEWSFRSDIRYVHGVAFRMSAAVRDVGLGRTTDIDVATTLDAGIVSTVQEALDGWE
ncbi:hypothetical protein AN216_14105 [Streptomyces oceani]|uniref:4'-phosphopantetheinyl transferase domain-containing protein n=1 Tax=Streptomyces oceani TaxID=1075402 RepID=A0A1E7KG29_9ACTN|nr:hypothetical protein AN216_14105 [Streptomyces oceani]